MKRKILRTIIVRSFAPVIMLGAAWQAQDAKASDPTMAPLPDCGSECRDSLGADRSPGIHLT